MYPHRVSTKQYSVQLLVEKKKIPRRRMEERPPVKRRFLRADAGHTCVAIDGSRRGGGGGSIVRNRGCSVVVFAGLLRIACCVPFLTSEQKVPRRGYLTHSPARPPGVSIIIGREEIKRLYATVTKGGGGGPYPGRGVSVPCSYIPSLAAGRLIIIEVVVNANGFCGL